MKKTNSLSVIAVLLAATHSNAQNCNPNIERTAPDSRYQLLNNGSEVKDTQTNLIWLRCSLGYTWNGTSCAGTATTYSWTKALQTAANIGNGWRLPNIKELASLVEESCYSPSINETYFPKTMSDYYRSSSPDAYNNSYSFIIHFGKGYDYQGSMYDSNYVRLVRSSQ